jgi:hypothetical protein
MLPFWFFFSFFLFSFLRIAGVRQSPRSSRLEKLLSVFPDKTRRGITASAASSYIYYYIIFLPREDKTKGNLQNMGRPKFCYSVRAAVAKKHKMILFYFIFWKILNPKMAVIFQKKEIIKYLRPLDIIHITYTRYISIWYIIAQTRRIDCA